MSPAATWPRTTVVVPTRSRPELLRSTLTAIAAQDYPGRVDVLVVFDQSEPDTSLEATEQRDGPRTVRVLTNTRTPGLAGTSQPDVRR